jgi:hypothetical protein
MIIVNEELEMTWTAAAVTCSESYPTVRTACLWQESKGGPLEHGLQPLYTDIFLHVK